MLDERFVFLAACCNIVGGGSYVLATFRGRTRPNRVTWGLWAAIPMIAFAAELSEGVGLRSLMTFMVGFGPFMVVIASTVNRDAFWQLGRLDVVCGALSVVAVVGWRLTGSGVVAIGLSILADAFAGVPTFVKSYREPSTEHPLVFTLGAASALITLLTVDEWSVAAAAFPAYIATVGIVVTLLLVFPTIGPGRDDDGTTGPIEGRAQPAA